MARPKARTVWLVDWVKGRPEEAFIEFESDEFLEVLPFGSLLHDFVDKLRAEWNPEDGSTKAEARRRDLRKERATVLIRSWNLKDEKGNKYKKLYEGMTPDLEACIDAVIVTAFETPEDAKARVGEDSNSIAPLTDAVLVSA
jgi:hypothetical protein